MNKQEVMKKLTDAKHIFRHCWSNDYARDGFEEGINFALETVNKLDEPEKPLLSKEEAEWVDKLTEFFDTPDALYRITRCGYSHWFTFDFCGDTYELPIEEDTDYAELTIIKERLVNAVIYGYEVKKEKLYTVEIPNPNDSVHTILHRTEKGIIISYSTDENYKNIKQNQLTEAEIKQDFEWAWQFAKEVEE